MAQSTPILDLGPLVERSKVRIDGKLYEVRTPDELTYLAHREHGKMFDRSAVLAAKKRRSKTEEAEFLRLLDRVAKQILVDVPDPVHAKLSNAQRIELIGFFGRLASARAKSRAAVMAPVTGQPTRSATGKN